MAKKIAYGPVRFANNGVRVCEKVSELGWVCVEPNGTVQEFNSKNDAILWSRNYEGPEEGVEVESTNYSYFGLDSEKNKVSKASTVSET